MHFKKKKRKIWFDGWSCQSGSETRPGVHVDKRGRLAAPGSDRWGQLLPTTSERARACTPAGDSRRHARTQEKHDPDGQQLEENHTRRDYYIPSLITLNMRF